MWVAQRLYDRGLSVLVAASFLDIGDRWIQGHVFGNWAAAVRAARGPAV
jgi:hypothetical protein